MSDVPSRPRSLDDYPAYAERVVDRNPQMDESNTKHKLVDPLLDLLGWDVAMDVELEYSVQMGRTTKHVDYALHDDGSPAIFVEAKGCDSELTAGNRDQLESYLKQQNVDWGLLTNGQQFELLRRRFSGNDIVIDVLGAFSLDDFEEHADLLRALSKESIRSGESDRIAAAIREYRRARETLRENKDELAERVARVVTDEVGDTISQRVENRAKAFIDDLATDLEEQVRARPEPEGNDEPGVWSEIEARTGVRRDGDALVFPDTRSATASFVAFVTFLFEEGYLSADDLPIKFGRKRYVLNTRPVHSDGDSMYEPKEIRDGIYLETHANVDQLQRNALQLAAYCGIDD